MDKETFPANSQSPFNGKFWVQKGLLFSKFKETFRLGMREGLFVGVVDTIMYNYAKEGPRRKVYLCCGALSLMSLTMNKQVRG